MSGLVGAAPRGCGYHAASGNTVHEIGVPASEPADRRRLLGQGEVNRPFSLKKTSPVRTFWTIRTIRTIYVPQKWRPPWSQQFENLEQACTLM